jgi:hypothetical protein
LIDLCSLFLQNNRFCSWRLTSIDVTCYNRMDDNKWLQVWNLERQTIYEDINSVKPQTLL